jgi:hypothetical protein
MEMADVGNPDVHAMVALDTFAHQLETLFEPMEAWHALVQANEDPTDAQYAASWASFKQKWLAAYGNVLPQEHSVYASAYFHGVLARARELSELMRIFL